jgi:hypothetical protein
MQELFLWKGGFDWKKNKGEKEELLSKKYILYKNKIQKIRKIY